MKVGHSVTSIQEVCPVNDSNHWTVLLKFCRIFKHENGTSSVGRVRSVGIASGYGLDGPEIESPWWWNFPHPSTPALGPTQPSEQRIRGLSRGVKRPGRGVNHPPTSSAEVIEREELYLYSPSGPSWPVIGWTLHFTFRKLGPSLQGENVDWWCVGGKKTHMKWGNRDMT
jgi:hypothetical protein